MGVTTLGFEIGGHRVAVALPDHLADRIGPALAEYVIDTPAPIGLLLKAPERPGGLYVVADRSGLIIARCRTADEALASLAALLASFVPIEAQRYRFRLRALIDRDDRVILALWPLLFVPMVIERRLHDCGYRLLDRLVVDIDEHGGVHAPDVPWVELNWLEAAPGHATRLSGGRVTRVLVAGSGPRLGTASLVAACGASFAGDDRAGALASIQAALDGTSSSWVALEEPGALYCALTG